MVWAIAMIAPKFNHNPPFEVLNNFRGTFTYTPVIDMSYMAVI